MDDKLRKHGNTTKSVFFSTFFSLIARLLSFVQAIIVSHYFGATKSTDFLFFMISITMLLPGLFSNINQSVIIPNAIKIRENKSSDESKAFLLYIYIFYIILGIIVCTLVAVVPEQFMGLASKFSPEDIHENRLIILLTIPTFFTILTTSFILNVFESYKLFTFPMIMDMMKSALTILFIVFLGSQYGVVSMAYGILLANIIQFVLLNYFLFKMLGFRFKPRKYTIDKTIRKNIAFVVISQVSAIISQYVGLYLISGLQEGVYTALSYSERLLSIFVLVLASQVTTVLGINIIEMYAKGDFLKLNDSYQKYLRILLTVIMPMSFIMAFQAPAIISVLFERGNFNSESVIMTSLFFKYAILTVPLLLLDRLIVRLIIAKQVMHVSFLWNVISKALTAVVAFVVINHINFQYYSLGLLIVQAVYVVMINIFMVRKEFQFINVKKSLRYLAVSSLISYLTCFFISKVYSLENMEGAVNKIAALLIYSALVFGTYTLIGFLTYNRETVIQLLRYFGQLIPKFTRQKLERANKSA